MIDRRKIFIGIMLKRGTKGFYETMTDISGSLNAKKVHKPVDAENLPQNSNLG